MHVINFCEVTRIIKGNLTNLMKSNLGGLNLYIKLSPQMMNIIFKLQTIYLFMFNKWAQFSWILKLVYAHQFNHKTLKLKANWGYRKYHMDNKFVKVISIQELKFFFLWPFSIRKIKYQFHTKISRPYVILAPSLPLLQSTFPNLWHVSWFSFKRFRWWKPNDMMLYM